MVKQPAIQVSTLILNLDGVGGKKSIIDSLRLYSYRHSKRSMYRKLQVDKFC